MAIVNVRGTEYYMHDTLKKHWDKIKDGALARRDNDEVIVCDGRERMGKSLFVLQQAAYIDPTLLDDGENGELLPRITFSTADTLKAIRETKSTKEHTKVIVFDEAFRGLSSRSVLSKENKAIISALQEMGQSNLVLFIVTPSFFLLELYAAVLRSQFLIHIDMNKRGSNKGRRMFKVFNYKKKGVLYRNGVRKGWNYNQPTKLKGYFSNKYPMGDDFEKRYRKKKAMYLGRVGLNEKVEENESRDNIFVRNVLVKLRNKGLSYAKIKKEVKEEYNWDLGEETIRTRIGIPTIKAEKLELCPVPDQPTIIN